MQIAAGSDEVIFGITLPSDTVVNRVRATISVIGENQKPVTTMLAYSCRGYILPVFDPDAQANYETLWDQLVPKDTDVQAVDLDTGAQDATPFFEPGEADWTQMLDIGLRPRMIFQKTRFMTMLTHSYIRFQDNQTPFSAQWLGGDVVNVDITRRMYVRQPSVLVFGVASPAFDDTQSVKESVLTEQKIAQTKYMGDTLKRGLMSLIGLVEAGAETPWDEAVDLLQEHLNPDPFEESATRMGTDTWNVLSEASISHSVKGELGVSSISM